MYSFLKKLKSHIIKRKTLAEQYPQYEIGRGTYGSPKIFSWDKSTSLKIGAFCSIAHGVEIFLGGEHRIDWVTTYPFSVFWKSAKLIEGHPKTKGDIIIGNDVWIGSHAKILSGVSIGDGAVIGTGAVISKDVPAYAIMVGNPARIIRKRFDDETIRLLLEISWWKWQDDKINEFMPLLLNNNIESFIKEAVLKYSK